MNCFLKCQAVFTFILLNTVGALSADHLSVVTADRRTVYAPIEPITFLIESDEKSHVGISAIIDVKYGDKVLYNVTGTRHDVGYYKNNGYAYLQQSTKIAMTYSLKHERLPSLLPVGKYQIDVHFDEQKMKNPEYNKSIEIEIRADNTATELERIIVDNNLCYLISADAKSIWHSRVTSERLKSSAINDAGLLASMISENKWNVYDPYICLTLMEILQASEKSEDKEVRALLDKMTPAVLCKHIESVAKQHDHPYYQAALGLYYLESNPVTALGHLENCAKPHHNPMLYRYSSQLAYKLKLQLNLLNLTPAEESIRLHLEKHNKK